MTRTELLTAAIQAKAIAEMAGTRRDSITAAHRAWACKVAELVITERVHLITERVHLITEA